MIFAGRLLLGQLHYPARLIPSVYLVRVLPSLSTILRITHLPGVPAVPTYPTAHLPRLGLTSLIMTAGFQGYDDDDTAARRSENPGPAEPTLLDEIIEDTTDPNRIVTKAPAEHFRLGLLDVACLVINRMIGTSTYSGLLLCRH